MPEGRSRVMNVPGQTVRIRKALVVIAAVIACSSAAMPVAATNPNQSVTVSHGADGCTVTVTIDWVGFPGGKDTAEVNLVLDGIGYGSLTSPTAVRGHGGTFSGQFPLNTDGSVHNLYGWGQLRDGKGAAIAGSVGTSIVSGAYCKG